MTITFRCPHCNCLVGFADEHAGKRAKCLSCQRRFVIPSESGLKVEKVADEKEKPGKPVPGFYRAAILDTWFVIWDRETLQLLIWIVIGVSIRFGGWFIAGGLAKDMTLGGGGDVLTGFGVAFKVAIEYGIVAVCIFVIAMFWGRIWDWYISIASITAVETDVFIEPMEVGSLMFWHHGLKPFIFAGLIFIAAGLPLFAGMMIFDWTGVEYNLLSFQHGWQIVLQVLAAMSILLLPSVFISLVINKDMDALTPMNIFPPIIKRFIPYVFISAAMSSVLYLDFKLTFIDLYQHTTFETIRTNFLPVLGLQLCMVLVMRWLGLFYRHYSCYFKY